MPVIPKFKIGKLRKKASKQQKPSSKQERIDLRETLLDAIYKAGSGHVGGSLSSIDILYVLYQDILRHNPKNPTWEERDRFVLSAGHLAPALYVVLAEHGYFPKKELETLRKLDSRLQGHPEQGLLPGIENTSGPLGQGYLTAVGKALAGKIHNHKWHVYCLASDGEHDEGAIWEAAQFAAHHKLGNLCVIIDCNSVQIDGYTKDILDLRSIKQKYKAFGWKVIEIDGHHKQLIKDTLTYFTYHSKDEPFCIIAHTTLGKGVSFMENNPTWHGKAPSYDELVQAKKELEQKKNNLTLKQQLINRGMLK
jgi:transketolase